MIWLMTWRTLTSKTVETRMMKAGRQRTRWRQSRMTASSPSPNTLVAPLPWVYYDLVIRQIQSDLLLFFSLPLSRLGVLCESGSCHEQHGGDRRRGWQGVCLEVERWRSSAGVLRWVWKAGWRLIIHTFKSRCIETWEEDIYQILCRFRLSISVNFDLWRVTHQCLIESDLFICNCAART